MSGAGSRTKLEGRATAEQQFAQALQVKSSPRGVALRLVSDELPALRSASRPVPASACRCGVASCARSSPSGVTAAVDPICIRRCAGPQCCMLAAATAWIGIARTISQINNERRDNRIEGETLAELGRLRRWQSRHEPNRARETSKVHWKEQQFVTASADPPPTPPQCRQGRTIKLATVAMSSPHPQNVATNNQLTLPPWEGRDSQLRHHTRQEASWRNS